jgi:hypothetical protein
VIDFSKVDTCTLVLSVKDQRDKGIANYPFWITIGVRDSSGGHDHTVGRPIGRLVTSDKETKDTVKSFHGKTDSTGTSKFRYLCSGFGGYDSVYVEGLTKKDTANLTILVTMPKFDSLESGAHYFLIGQYGTGSVESPHRLNHYGSKNLIKTIKALADTAYSDTKVKLRINDISLIFGGPFDCSTHSLWNTPHQEHREGVSVDIDDQTLSANGQLTQVSVAKINEWVRNFMNKPSVKNEGDHFHVTVR